MVQPDQMSWEFRHFRPTLATLHKGLGAHSPSHENATQQCWETWRASVINSHMKVSEQWVWELAARNCRGSCTSCTILWSDESPPTLINIHINTKTTNQFQISTKNHTEYSLAFCELQSERASLTTCCKTSVSWLFHAIVPIHGSFCSKNALLSNKINSDKRHLAHSLF